MTCWLSLWLYEAIRTWVPGEELLFFDQLTLLVLALASDGSSRSEIQFASSLQGRVKWRCHQLSQGLDLTCQNEEHQSFIYHDLQSCNFDVCGPLEVVHIAIEQGEIAATNAAVKLGKLPESKKREIDYRLKLFGVFTEPQMGAVGLSEAEAKAQGVFTAETLGEVETFLKAPAAWQDARMSDTKS